jgi:hypothetical protein
VAVFLSSEGEALGLIIVLGLLLGGGEVEPCLLLELCSWQFSPSE